MIRLAWPAALVASALLAACTGSAPENRDAQAGRGSAAAASKDSRAEWRLTTAGFGPLRIGMTPAEARAALGDFAVIRDAADKQPEECHYARSTALPAGVGVMIERNRVVRVDVDTVGIKTAEGASVGDSEVRIQQLYTDLRVEPHHYVAEGKYLTVLRSPDDTLYRVVFETDGERVTRFRAGVFPPVAYVEGCG